MGFIKEIIDEEYHENSIEWSARAEKKIKTITRSECKNCKSNKDCGYKVYRDRIMQYIHVQDYSCKDVSEIFGIICIRYEFEE